MAKAAEVEWRLNVFTVESRPESLAFKAFADRVSANSGGRLEIQVFYGGSLGIEASDALRALKSASIEAAHIFSGYFGRDAPDLALAFPQGVIIDPKENLAIQPEIQAITTEYLKSWDIEVVGWILSNAYDVSVVCRDQPIRTLADLKGKKLRVWGKDQVQTFEKLGVAAQIVGQNDLYVALQTGVLDCALYVLGIAKTISLQEVTDYASSLHVYSVVPQGIGVAKRDWEALPDDLKAVVREAGQWIYEQTIPVVTDTSMEDAAVKEFTESGTLSVIEPFSAEDRKLFFDTVAEVWEASATDVGRNAPGYRSRMMDALAKIRSAN
jgi:TRAP-type C4-dicarboxylate transport system substrate-binding protein